MFKSVLLASFCLVLVSASNPKTHLQQNSRLFSSLSSCDVQSIKDLVSQVTSLTSDTGCSIMESALIVGKDLAYCLWPFDIYTCLMGDMEFEIEDNIKEIIAALGDYFEKVQPLLKEISEEINACASV